MKNLAEKTFKEVYDDFVKAKTAQEETEYPIRNYHCHVKSIEKHIDVNIPFHAKKTYSLQTNIMLLYL